MISTNEFRTGLTIELDQDPWQIMDFQHVKPGKGAAFVRTKLRNLRNDNIQERTFRAGEKVSRAHVESRQMQYLYNTGDAYTFMDNETYEQVNLPADRLQREINFLKENMNVSIVSVEGEVLGVELPNTIELEVVSTEPGIKGNTASGGSKPATLETGLTVQVPFFINVGDRLVIDTRSEEYVSRA